MPIDSQDEKEPEMSLLYRKRVPSTTILKVRCGGRSILCICSKTGDFSPHLR
jgi:hypothetical protein